MTAPKPPGKPQEKGQRFDPRVSGSTLVKLGLAAALCVSAYNVVSGFMNEAKRIAGSVPKRLEVAEAEAVSPARPVDTTEIPAEKRQQRQQRQRTLDY